MMTRALKFVTAVCSSWDLQVQARLYARDFPFVISEQTAYQDQINQYYMNLDTFLREKYPISAAGGFTELIPAKTLASVFKAENLRLLREYLERCQVRDVITKTQAFAAALETYDKNDTTVIESVYQQFQSAEKAVSLLKEDTSSDGLVADLENLLAAIQKLMMEKDGLVETAKGDLAAKLRAAVQEIDRLQGGRGNGTDVKGPANRFS